MPEQKMVRLFVAIFPPRAVVDRLNEESIRVRRQLAEDAVRWAPGSQIHITMNFIGSVDSARVPDYSRALEDAVGRHRRFAVRAVGVGCFPNARQPRIIWAGLDADTRVMISLKEDIDQVLIPLGYVPEDRKFHPHLTLGRVNRLGRRDVDALSGWLSAAAATEFGAWETDRIQLMQSTLAPSGATYSAVQDFALPA